MIFGTFRSLRVLDQGANMFIVAPMFKKIVKPSSEIFERSSVMFRSLQVVDQGANQFQVASPYVTNA